ncbi:uncharacterized protein J3D65DRAFT_232331 [Phyllosticta citribraziliensis]|uniref:Six-bladed beta-propeller-like protein n=1 Tax=Phyllosticta citribraziliensis TaxID=989973 RepID=A0ABR1M5M0_9PEZI
MADDAQPQVTHVTQLPDDSWCEGILSRPNGQILAARLDLPGLYTFDPKDQSAEPTLLHTFPDAEGLTNLCALSQSPDQEEYAVIAGRFDVKTVSIDSKSWVVWRVTLRGEEAPVVTKIVELADAGLVIDVTPGAPQSPDTLLLADSEKSSIWKLDMRTGQTAIFLADTETMAKATPDEFFGINTLARSDNHIWWTNTSKGLVCRVAVDEAGNAAGPVQTVATDLLNSDGLTAAADGSAAYTAGYMSGLLWKVEVDGAGTGTVTEIATGLNSPSALHLDEGVDKAKLYVACCGDKEVGWIDDDRLSSSAKQIEVSVSVEISSD